VLDNSPRLLLFSSSARRRLFNLVWILDEAAVSPRRSERPLPRERWAARPKHGLQDPPRLQPARLPQVQSPALHLHCLFCNLLRLYYVCKFKYHFSIAFLVVGWRLARKHDAHISLADNIHNTPWIRAEEGLVSARLMATRRDLEGRRLPRRRYIGLPEDLLSTVQTT
jgi:hypothetical protein